MKKTYYLLLLCLIFNSALFAMTDRNGEIIFKKSDKTCLSKVFEQAIATFKGAKRIQDSTVPQNAPIQYIEAGSKKYGVFTPPVIDRKVLSDLIDSLEALIEHPEKKLRTHLIPLREINKNGKKFDCGIIASSDKIQNVLYLLKNLLRLAKQHEVTKRNSEKSKSALSLAEKTEGIREKKYKEKSNTLLDKSLFSGERAIICGLAGHTMGLIALLILQFTGKLKDEGIVTPMLVLLPFLTSCLFLLILAGYEGKTIHNPYVYKLINTRNSEIDELNLCRKKSGQQDRTLAGIIEEIKEFVKKLDEMFENTSQRVFI